MNTIPTILPFSQLNVSGSLSQKVATFSDHLRLEREARELQREHHRAEQRNEFNAACVRIAAWEKLHALQLPFEPEHPVLFVIANHTRLSMAQIRHEQAARATLRARRFIEGTVDLDVYPPRNRH